MKPEGLTTLADLPVLLGKGPTTSTIAIARLDNKLYDKRYGAFKIEQADVDGWQRNLTETFGGRVAVDFDHSSDRGGGTRAAGWVTGLHQDGKLVTADVEWTKRGARAIRRGDYRHISPTFVTEYKDEHGASHGRALIGAGLTNRPVLRRDMPTVSLSREPFDGVAVTLSKKRKLKKAKLKRKAKRMKLAPYATPRPAAKVSQEIRKMALAAGVDRDEVKLMTSAGSDPALRTLWADQILSSAAPEPRGRELRPVYALSQDGALTRLEQRDGLGEGVEPAMRGRVDPDRQALDQSARRLSKQLGIDYVSAVETVVHAREHLELANQDGSSTVEHLDTSRPMETTPYNPDHWERDSRRAASAGLDLSKEVWSAYAEMGRDCVHELAAQKRADDLADHEAAGRSRLADAQGRGRVAAVKAENQKALERQQRERQKAALAREDRIHGAYNHDSEIWVP